jgi:glycosyltransferase involved in cell wall biosynthesis
VDKFPFQAEKSDYYLTVSRLVSYKKVGLIVEAFNQLGLPLVVIGDGTEMAQIRAVAKSNITFLGSVDDETVKKYMSHAKAFVYAACEDFGIAIVEAQACGTPVIAYDGGGATETVIDIRKDAQKGTGILFSPQTVEGLLEAIKTFNILEKEFQPETNRLHAQQFSPEVFKQEYLAFFDHCWQNFEPKKTKH